MVSNTRHSQTRREMRHQSMGRGAAKLRAKLGTPSFPLHPAGYDSNAPDARKTTTSAKNSAK